MESYRTHLTVVDESVARYPLAPAFRVPQLDIHTGEVQEWRTVTYQQFQHDVDHFSRYWAHTLQARGILQRSVVGIWLGGMTYIDLLHIYGVARAGYIPQLFSLRLPNPDVILELLKKSKGMALIHDVTYLSVLRACPVPTFTAIDAFGVTTDSSFRPYVMTPRSDDTLMIFHTSGSTSGCPKLVPCSYAWWDTMIGKAAMVMKPKSRSQHRQDVTVSMGSMCHIGQTFMLVGALQNGICTVQVAQQTFSSDELVDMIHRCGLTRMNIFPTYLSRHLRNSRHDSKLLTQLRGLDDVFISGLSLTQEDEQWICSNGIKVRNCYGSTECTAMMLSSPVNAGHKNLPPLRPVAGMSYAFVPLPSSQQNDEYVDANSQLLEMVILARSPDCPDRSLRHADGNYHTGDLFMEVAPGSYVFRGRDDDWIKSENSLRCDTRAIEQNALATCEDLITDCIVVGNGRPSPVLFAEPRFEVDEELLKKDIMRRTRHFHSRRYMHERIASTRFIKIVPRNTLPRTATKGNIRRRAVEETFKTELDHIYGIDY